MRLTTNVGLTNRCIRVACTAPLHQPAKPNPRLPKPPRAFLVPALLAAAEAEKDGGGRRRRTGGISEARLFCETPLPVNQSLHPHK